MTPWWCQAQERLRHRSEERRKKVRPTTAWRIGSHVRASDSDRLKEHITHACSCLVICILNYIILYIILLYYIILYFCKVISYLFFYYINMVIVLYSIYFILFYTILYILIILFYSTLYYFFVMVWYFIIFFKNYYMYIMMYDNKHFLHIMHMPVRVHVSSTFPVLNWHNRTTVPKSRAPLLVISISVSLCFICLLLEPPQPSKCCLLRCTKWAPHPINFWIIRHD